jgi:hypothetical protein
VIDVKEEPSKDMKKKDHQKSDKNLPQQKTDELKQ